MKRSKAVVKASTNTMLNATIRANELNRSKGYFYGNLGDSIERRFNGSTPFLGEGHDGFNGTYGPNTSWPAQGYGNYFGTGLLNGFGRMSSGITGNLGGGGFTYLRRFSSSAVFMHQIIAQCMLAYLGYGVVRNVIDLYADFATEGLEIEHPDESVRNFYRAWATKVKLRDRIYSLFCNTFISGNTFIHRRWANLSDQEKRSMKRAKSSIMVDNSLIVRCKFKDVTIDGGEKSFIDWFLKQKEFTLRKIEAAAATPAPIDEDLPTNEDKLIPWGYTFLNPLQMELRGRKLRGDSYWIMAIDRRDTLDIAKGMGLNSKYNQDLGTTDFNLPREFLNRIRAYQGPGAGYVAEIKLDKEELAVIQAPGKWDWFDWAVPFLYPVLRCLSFKDCLRNMEAKACESVINSIFLFKLGNIDKGIYPEDEHFERLADMLQQPGQVLNILWNDAISAQVVQADVKGIFDPKKHESADKDILVSLGIPEVLLGGKGGSFSNSYVSVAAVLERLESARDKAHDWAMGEMKLIADAMGFQKLPSLRFGRTSLKDEKAFQSFLTGLYDRGILSGDTLLKEADTSAEIEAAKMKEEKTKYREKDIFEPRGPFIKEPKLPGNGQPKTSNGRPPNSSTGPTGKQSNPRQPQGQNLASLLELQEIYQGRGKAMLEQIENFINDRFLLAKAKENPDLKHIKNLRAQDKERLEWLIYNIFSNMPPPPSDEAIKEDFIIHMLRSPAAEQIKADIFHMYTNKIAEYSKTYGKMPSREMRRNFMCSAWTQRAILTLYDKDLE